MTSKKVFEKAARIVRELSYNKSYKLIAENSFVELFLHDNPRFDEERFRNACNKEVK